jgi:hypothetical protein
VVFAAIDGVSIVAAAISPRPAQIPMNQNSQRGRKVHLLLFGVRG